MAIANEMAALPSVALASTAVRGSARRARAAAVARLKLAWIRGVLPLLLARLTSMAVAASSKWNFKKSAKFLDRVRIACRVPRWGTTSFDVEYVGTVDGGACFDGLVTYVSVDAETRRPTPVPRDLKEALSATRSKM